MGGHGDGSGIVRAGGVGLWSGKGLAVERELWNVDVEAFAVLRDVGDGCRGAGPVSAGVVCAGVPDVGVHHSAGIGRHGSRGPWRRGALVPWLSIVAGRSRCWTMYGSGQVGWRGGAGWGCRRDGVVVCDVAVAPMRGGGLALASECRVRPGRSGSGNWWQGGGDRGREGRWLMVGDGEGSRRGCRRRRGSMAGGGNGVASGHWCRGCWGQAAGSSGSVTQRLGALMRLTMMSAREGLPMTPSVENSWG